MSKVNLCIQDKNIREAKCHSWWIHACCVLSLIITRVSLHLSSRHYPFLCRRVPCNPHVPSADGWALVLTCGVQSRATVLLSTWAVPFWIFLTLRFCKLVVVSRQITLCMYPRLDWNCLACAGLTLVIFLPQAPWCWDYTLCQEAWHSFTFDVTCFKLIFVFLVPSLCDQSVFRNPCLFIEE